jgi:hypothetical protein
MAMLSMPALIFGYGCDFSPKLNLLLGVSESSWLLISKLTERVGAAVDSGIGINGSWFGLCTLSNSIPSSIG